jgi:hypothetical protein
VGERGFDAGAVSVIAAASLMNDGIRLRRAHFSQWSSSAMPSEPSSANT